MGLGACTALWPRSHAPNGRTSRQMEPGSMTATPIAETAPGVDGPRIKGQTPEVDAQTVDRWMREGNCVLIDVREADEHARERIAGSTNLPLSSFRPSQLPVAHGQRVVLHCKSGRRSSDALRLADTADSPLARFGVAAFSMAGGIEAWKRAGLAVEVDRRAPAMSVMRQVQLIIGAGVLLGSILAYLVHPAFVGIAAFFGAGLVFAGATGTCGLAAVLARMPWNRGGACGTACEPPTSTRPR